VLDLAAAAEERHERFLSRVVEAGVVWGLKDAEDQWPVTASTDDEERSVMPFWSDRAYAAQCATEDWAPYEPTEIPLDLFLDEWLPGMAADGVLVGTNWNVQLIGQESEPLELQERLLSDLEAP
jgi:hypothetical protein